MREIDYEVMRYAFATQNRLGCLCDESVYQAHLSQLLTEVGFQAEREVPVRLIFRSFEKVLFLDLIVNGSVIYELKAVTSLTESHTTQLLNYLFLTNSTHGKLVNFRTSSVESRFVNAAMDAQSRRSFQVDTSHWQGSTEFRALIETLVTDWGTGLEHSFYTQAVVHCLGGEEIVTRQLPMQVDGIAVGNQRFHLINKNTGFRITTFQDELHSQHANQLMKLLIPSPLKLYYWVNIARHKICLRSFDL